LFSERYAREQGGSNDVKMSMGCICRVWSNDRICERQKNRNAKMIFLKKSEGLWLGATGAVSSGGVAVVV
jgi:hypothetical protein